MLIIAVDPGNEKTGIACLSYDGTLYEKKIVPSQTLEDALMAMVQRAQSDNHVVTHVVCGNGTNHKKLFTVVQRVAAKAQLPAAITDEAHTTEEARKRYWDYNPPKGLKRFVPRGMLYPPEPVDDFTAWIIGERFLQKEGLYGSHV